MGLLKDAGTARSCRPAPDRSACRSGRVPTEVPCPCPALRIMLQSAAIPPDGVTPMPRNSREASLWGGPARLQHQLALSKSRCKSRSPSTCWTMMTVRLESSWVTRLPCGTQPPRRRQNGQTGGVPAWTARTGPRNCGEVVPLHASTPKMPAPQRALHAPSTLFLSHLRRMLRLLPMLWLPVRFPAARTAQYYEALGPVTTSHRQWRLLRAWVRKALQTTVCCCLTTRCCASPRDAMVLSLAAQWRTQQGATVQPTRLCRKRSRRVGEVAKRVHWLVCPRHLDATVRT